MAAVEGLNQALPEAPTTGEELKEAWGLPDEHWHSLMIKVLRRDPGSAQAGLLTEVPLKDYSMRQLAARYGPGYYLVKPGPGLPRPLNQRIARMEILETYAREAGWPRQGVLPATPTRVMAAEIHQAATERPLSQTELNAMLEVAVRDAILKERAAQPDPLAKIQEMIAMGTAIKQMQELFGGGSASPAAPTSSPWADIALQLIRTGEPLVGALSQRLAFGAQAQQQGKPVEVPLPVSAQLIEYLRMNADALIQLVAESPNPAAAAAALKEQIPALAMPEIRKLQAEVQARGVVILGAIAPGLGTAAMGQMLEELVR